MELRFYACQCGDLSVLGLPLVCNLSMLGEDGLGKNITEGAYGLLEDAYWGRSVTGLLSGVPDYFGRNKILSGGDLSHYSSASLY